MEISYKRINIMILEDQYRQLNEQGLLETLQQAGWQLSFSRYQTLDSHILPSKIRLQQGDITLTLLIKRWSLTPSLTP